MLILLTFTDCSGRLRIQYRIPPQTTRPKPHHLPKKKNTKRQGAGGMRVRRASAKMRENLTIPEPRRTGQAKCYTH